MIKSMTSYGRGQTQGEHLGFSVEIKTVNHRYADVNIKAPRLLAPLDAQIKKQVTAVFKRGKIDVFITQNNTAQLTVRPIVNTQVAMAYLDVFEQLKDISGVSGGVSLELLAAQQDVMTLVDVAFAEQEIESCLNQALNAALQAAMNMRVAEGSATAVDVEERVAALNSCLQQIEGLADLVPLEWQKKLSERLTRLQGIDADPQRVAQELAVFADRCDISEEIVRFRSHLQQFCELLKHEEPVGRQMDFLVQELNREANTMGSKSNDAALTRCVVTLKSELEKIREQVQNIE